MEAPDRVPVRDDLADVVPYGAPQLDVIVRLNTNETPRPPSDAYIADLARRVVDVGSRLNRYPDRPATDLRRAIAARFDLDEGRVWAANGSNEVLLQLFQAYGGPGRRLLLTRPGYSAHPLIARVSCTEVVEAELPEDFILTPAHAAQAVASFEPDLVCVASPANPTGVPVSLDAIAALHDGSRALVVVDEAYVEFGGTSGVELLDQLPRMVVVRTFSKAFRLAGLRLGYLLAPDWVIDDIQRVRLPYHLDAIKQVAAITALDHADELLDHIPGIRDERDRMAGGLRDLGVVVWPSEANFLLFRAGVGRLFDRLLEAGVLVRDFSASPGTEGCLRVTIGTPSENDLFLATMTTILEES